jgi:predicted 2-oxoglutarate/Fe(II)-dependent dioxygenase YbiX
MKPFSGMRSRRTDRFLALFSKEPVERFDGSELVVLDIEDGVELGDVENVLNLLAQVHQL